MATMTAKPTLNSTAFFAIFYLSNKSTFYDNIIHIYTNMFQYIKVLAKTVLKFENWIFFHFLTNPVLVCLLCLFIIPGLFG